MKNRTNRLTTLGAALAVLLSLLPLTRAKADLVLEDGAGEGRKDQGRGDDDRDNNRDNNRENDGGEEREVTRKVVRKSRSVETSREVEAEATSADRSDSAEMAPAQKSELVRRKRMREEMKNEDLLQQRLEELRLRDEERRTKKVLKSTEADDETAEVSKPSRHAPRAQTEVVLEEEVVVAPVNERPTLPPAYQMSAAPSATQTVIVTPAPVRDTVRSRQSGRARENDASPAPVYGGSESKWRADEGSSFAPGVSLQPRLGFATISNGDFQFNPRFSAGVGLGFDVSENLGMEFGYTYAETGINYQNTYYQTQYNYGNSDTLSYKQHIFDALLKLNLLDTSSRVRPYIGGGLGYSMGSLNYSDRIQQVNRAYGVNTQDYELKSFMGILTAGIDLKVADNVSIGGSYKYLRPLSSSEDQQVNTGAFYPQYYDAQRDYVRASLKNSNISIFQVAAAFQF